MERQYMRQLDAFRFFAAAAVMLAHWTMDVPFLYRFTKIGSAAGVDLFFVLSGFLITQILMKSKQDSSFSRYLYIFYSRRFLRIFPLYYAVIFVSVLLKIPNARAYFYWLVSYTTNFAAAFNVGSLSYLSHLWSLAVEEQFYILFPFIIFWTGKKHFLKLFGILMGIALLFRASFLLWHMNTLNTIWMSHALMPGCMDSFAAGAILAYLKVNHIDWLRTLLKKWYIPVLSGGAYLVLSLGSEANLSLYIVFGRFLLAVTSFWIVGAGGLDMYKGVWARIIESPVLVYLGKISYGLYVYHFFMPWIFSHWSVPNETWYYFPATILISVLSWHLFELPINTFKRYFEYTGSKGIFLQRPHLLLRFKK
ncbi:MAG: acyltransferase [Bacteroidetes bacterium]|nr:acyltransferase [Bacteroidota bacterium]